MNDNYGKILKKQWATAEFKELAAEVHGGIGTHSIRKFASTWAAEHGCTYTEVEIRGWWKGGGRNGRVVKLYISTCNSYLLMERWQVSCVSDNQ